jgi:hypothetical protein
MSTPSEEVIVTKMTDVCTHCGKKFIMGETGSYTPTGVPLCDEHFDILCIDCLADEKLEDRDKCAGCLSGDAEMIRESREDR